MKKVKAIIETEFTIESEDESENKTDKEITQGIADELAQNLDSLISILEEEQYLVTVDIIK